MSKYLKHILLSMLLVATIVKTTWAESITDATLEALINVSKTDEYKKQFRNCYEFTKKINKKRHSKFEPWSSKQQNGEKKAKENFTEIQTKLLDISKEETITQAAKLDLAENENLIKAETKITKNTIEFKLKQRKANHIKATIADYHKRRTKRETILGKIDEALPNPQFQIQKFDSNQKFILPTVPLPTPPPFPGNFAFNSFASSSHDAANAAGSGVKKLQATQIFANAFAFPIYSPKSTFTSSTSCGGVLKARHGIIQTPNFPHKFQTPIECVWIIDASELPAMSSSAKLSNTGIGSGPGNISIVVYLTQLYVLGGVKFTEYMYYSDDYKVPAHRVFTLNEDDVTQATWIQFNSQYLEIRFVMSTLDGTHLRALDRLLDVYGFNITYEIQDQVKPYQCNTLQCRFLGHCYAKTDFSAYYCACFPGFSGVDCGRGPLCEDPHTNICQNGATCKHIGDAAITCHCPPGYKGTKCEIPEINEKTMGCTANTTSSDCHRECNFGHDQDNNALLKRSKSAGRSDKTRFEVTIRLGANLTAYYRNADGDKKSADHLPGLLERHVSYRKI